MINLGFMFFLFPVVLNLAYIDYSLCQIWSVYMQYLQCCDHSKKCLFLIIQRIEVLLALYFGECIKLGSPLTYHSYTSHFAKWYIHILPLLIACPRYDLAADKDITTKRDTIFLWVDKKTWVWWNTDQWQKTTAKIIFYLNLLGFVSWGHVVFFRYY